MNKKQRIQFRKTEYEKQPFCFWCGGLMLLTCETADREEIASIEHLTPRRRGGTDLEKNLRLVHKKCNK